MNVVIHKKTGEEFQVVRVRSDVVKLRNVDTGKMSHVKKKILRSDYFQKEAFVDTDDRNFFRGALGVRGPDNDIEMISEDDLELLL